MASRFDGDCLGASVVTSSRGGGKCLGAYRNRSNLPFLSKSLILSSLVLTHASFYEYGKGYGAFKRLHVVEVEFDLLKKMLNCPIKSMLFLPMMSIVCLA